MNDNKTESKQMFETIITKSKMKDASIPFDIGCAYLAPATKNIDEAIYT
jgi:hypothetical protein